MFVLSCFVLFRDVYSRIGYGVILYVVLLTEIACLQSRLPNSFVHNVLLLR